jgi:hypothetical protein
MKHMPYILTILAMGLGFMVTLKKKESQIKSLERTLKTMEQVDRTEDDLIKDLTVRYEKCMKKNLYLLGLHRRELREYRKVSNVTYGRYEKWLKSEKPKIQRRFYDHYSKQDGLKTLTIPYRLAFQTYLGVDEESSTD